MASREEHTESNISSTGSAFALGGGLYQISAKATWGGGNVVLQQLLPDGSTYASCSTALTADGVNTAYLPNGTYKVAVTTATAVYAKVSRIPQE